MRAPRTPPSQAYAPYGDRARLEGTARSEWLLHWLALLICCLMEPWNAARMIRRGRPPSWVDVHRRLGLPAGSTQEEAAAIRGPFGNAIAWMCLRRGIGPGHARWPELS